MIFMRNGNRHFRDAKLPGPLFKRALQMKLRCSPLGPCDIGILPGRSEDADSQRFAGRFPGSPESRIGLSPLLSFLFAMGNFIRREIFSALAGNFSRIRSQRSILTRSTPTNSIRSPSEPEPPALTFLLYKKTYFDSNKILLFALTFPVFSAKHRTF